MKTCLRSIVRLIDWLSCIIPNMLMEDHVKPPTDPIIYRMSILCGLIICACTMFGAFLIVEMLIYVVTSYPIASCSIVIVLGLFISIGYLRKKIEGKLK